MSDETTIIHPKQDLNINLKQGDVILYKGKGFIAYLIRALTKSNWNHIIWVLDEVSILESDSSAGGVVINPIQNYIRPKNIQEKRIRVLRIKNINPKHLNKAVEYAKSKIGLKYDYSSILYLFGMYLFKFFGFKIRVEDVKTNRFTCVELVANPLFLFGKWRCEKDLEITKTVPGNFEDSPFTKIIQ